MCEGHFTERKSIEAMNPFGLLAISMTAYLAVALLKKVLADRYIIDGSAQQIYNAVTSFAAALTLLAVGDFSRLSAFTVLLGIAFGLITALQQIFSLRAIEIGSLSYTTVITSLSMLIPTLSGMIFWNETINVIQVLGILLMVGCLILSVEVGG